jgi:hypothetical protein
VQPRPATLQQQQQQQQQPAKKIQINQSNP